MQGAGMNTRRSEGWDLLIQGARLVQDGAERVVDIGVSADRVGAVGPQLDPTQAARVFDARGLYASAGWIDLHTHVFQGPGLVVGVNPDADAGVYRGVTSIVDAGSFGAAQYREFVQTTVTSAATRVLAFINISTDTTKAPCHGHYDNFNLRQTLATLDQDGGRVLVGIKVLAGQKHCGLMGIEPVKMAALAARLSETRLMCHIGHGPPVIADVLRELRAGDIVTHAWHGKPGGLMDLRGEPWGVTSEAVQRGVQFDLGHGASSFSFRVARMAREAGLPLHTISTDLHARSLAPVGDLANTLSKCMHLGWSLTEVIQRVTVNAARVIGWDDRIGWVAAGRVADLTLFRVEEGHRRAVDAEGTPAMLSQMVIPVATVRSGRLYVCDEQAS